MRRCLLTIGCSILLLCGCAGIEQPQSTPQPTVAESFETKMEISYQDLEATATLKREGRSAWQVQFEAPQLLEGLGFELAADEMTVTYRGLSVGLAPDELASSSIVKSIVDVIDVAAQKDGVEVSLEDGAFCLQGEGDNGDFTLRLDAEGQNFLHLSVPSQQLEVQFENFALLP